LRFPFSILTTTLLLHPLNIVILFTQTRILWLPNLLEVMLTIVYIKWGHFRQSNIKALFLRCLCHGGSKMLFLIRVTTNFFNWKQFRNLF
jgi:hypothetical protein